MNEDDRTKLEQQIAFNKKEGGEVIKGSSQSILKQGVGKGKSCS